MSVGAPFGSSRALRLDPFALPVRYAARDGGADGQIRQVELDRDRVVLRRAVRGIRMNVGVPVAEFRGVSIRMLPPDNDAAGRERGDARTPRRGAFGPAVHGRRAATS